MGGPGSKFVLVAGNWHRRALLPHEKEIHLVHEKRTFQFGVWGVFKIDLVERVPCSRRQYAFAGWSDNFD